jgi:hypothetical protein
VVTYYSSRIKNKKNIILLTKCIFVSCMAQKNSDYLPLNFWTYIMDAYVLIVRSNWIFGRSLQTNNGILWIWRPSICPSVSLWSSMKDQIVFRLLMKLFLDILCKICWGIWSSWKSVQWKSFVTWWRKLNFADLNFSSELFKECWKEVFRKLCINYELHKSRQ